MFEETYSIYYMPSFTESELIVINSIISSVNTTNDELPRWAFLEAKKLLISLTPKEVLDLREILLGSINLYDIETIFTK